MTRIGLGALRFWGGFVCRSGEREAGTASIVMRAFCEIEADQPRHDRPGRAAGEPGRSMRLLFDRCAGSGGRVP